LKTIGIPAASCEYRIKGERSNPRRIVIVLFIFSMSVSQYIGKKKFDKTTDHNSIVIIRNNFIPIFFLMSSIEMKIPIIASKEFTSSTQLGYINKNNLPLVQLYKKYQ